MNYVHIAKVATADVPLLKAGPATFLGRKPAAPGVRYYVDEPTWTAMFRALGVDVEVDEPLFRGLGFVGADGWEDLLSAEQVQAMAGRLPSDDEFRRRFDPDVMNDPRGDPAAMAEFMDEYREELLSEYQTLRGFIEEAAREGSSLFGYTE